MQENEIRMAEVNLAGRITSGPTLTSEGITHVMLQCLGEGQDPVYCVATGKTGENLRKYCNVGDEISVEGELRWMDFDNFAGSTLVVYMRHCSYGRKA